MRFSPVDTGNTCINYPLNSNSSVQPRGYGEHNVCFHVIAPLLGSAPWIRGTHIFAECSGLCGRFSPVDTGNTISKGFGYIAIAVQPRGYGEHNIKIKPCIFNDGSAPWIRGTPWQGNINEQGARFSPVDTGNTFEIYVESDDGTVQPRGYGEHSNYI